MHGRCVVLSPSGDERIYVYEHERLATSEATSMQVTFTFSYDAEGRLVRVDGAQRGVPSVEQHFTYDSDGRLVSRIMRGVQDGEARERWELVYDTGGRLSQAIRRDAEGSEQVCSLAYDRLGRLESHSCEAPPRSGLFSGTERLTYDEGGRVESIESVHGDLPPRRRELRYTPSGLLASGVVHDASGAVRASEDMTYDEDGRVSAIRSRGADTRLSYEGDFGPGSRCGAAAPAPTGVPAFELIRWFGLV
jgi:YD repeat-containing protein